MVTVLFIHNDVDHSISNSDGRETSPSIRSLAEECASCIIQAIWRSYSTRVLLSSRLDESSTAYKIRKMKDKSLNDAASKVQHFWQKYCSQYKRALINQFNKEEVIASDLATYIIQNFLRKIFKKRKILKTVGSLEKVSTKKSTDYKSAVQSPPVCFSDVIQKWRQEVDKNTFVEEKSFNKMDDKIGIASDYYQKPESQGTLSTSLSFLQHQDMVVKSETFDDSCYSTKLQQYPASSSASRSVTKKDLLVMDDTIKTRAICVDNIQHCHPPSLLDTSTRFLNNDSSENEPNLLASEQDLNRFRVIESERVESRVEESRESIISSGVSIAEVSIMKKDIFVRNVDRLPLLKLSMELPSESTKKYMKQLLSEFKDETSQMNFVPVISSSTFYPLNLSSDFESFSSQVFTLFRSLKSSPRRLSHNDLKKLHQNLRRLLRPTKSIIAFLTDNIGVGHYTKKQIREMFLAVGLQKKDIVKLKEDEILNLQESDYSFIESPFLRRRLSVCIKLLNYVNKWEKNSISRTGVESNISSIQSTKTTFVTTSKKGKENNNPAGDNKKNKNEIRTLRCAMTMSTLSLSIDAGFAKKANKQSSIRRPMSSRTTKSRSKNHRPFTASRGDHLKIETTNKNI